MQMSPEQYLSFNPTLDTTQLLTDRLRGLPSPPTEFQSHIGYDSATNSDRVLPFRTFTRFNPTLDTTQLLTASHPSRLGTERQSFNPTLDTTQLLTFRRASKQRDLGCRFNPTLDTTQLLTDDVDVRRARRPVSIPHWIRLSY